MKPNPNVIILAARGSKILPESDGEFHTSIEWLMHAFAENKLTNITIIGGKEIDELAKKYPSVQFYFNPHWEKSGAISSLILAEKELSEGCIITYADVVYYPSLIAKLLNEHKGDISVMMDTDWNERYPNRTSESLHKAEKLWVDSNNNVTKSGRESSSFDSVGGEIAGLMYCTPKGGQNILKTYNSMPRKSAVGMTDILHKITSKKILKIHATPTIGEWAELDEPQDFRRFVFGTKSQTLERLRPVLKNGVILPQYSFTVQKWKNQSDDIIHEIQNSLDESTLIIRSSATAEDSLDASQAGKFTSIMNIQKSDTKKLREAIENVIHSFGKLSTHEDQVLVQPQIQNVASSGVVFTCDIKTGAHYYVINNDASGSTDAITAGKEGDHELFYIYKHSKKMHKKGFIRILISCAKELEKLTGTPTLDIEYAFDKKGKLYIFQARPIASAVALDRYYRYTVKAEIDHAKEHVIQKLKRRTHLAGNTTILGDMPDWNPAELIGAHPKPLARTIFEELITKSAWRDARKILGYKNLTPENLMVTLCGHPYIDVRSSLNSYLPDTMPNDISEDIVNESLHYLKKHPDAHDKLEFEVATTCYSPAITDRKNRWDDWGISSSDQEKIHKHFLLQTEKILSEGYASIESLIDSVKILDKRRAEIMKNQTSTLQSDTISFLLEDCITMGTIPFSVLARMAFIGNTFLRSFKDKNIISQQSYDGFLNSIETVATKMGAALEKTHNKSSSLQTFLKTYGHLRPGTYEIESYRYDEKPQIYFGEITSSLSKQSQDFQFKWKTGEESAMKKSLKDIGVNVPLKEVLSFIRRSIQGREEAKFLYSKNISDALMLISQWGKQEKIIRSDLAFLSIQECIKLMGDVTDGKKCDHIHCTIAFAKHEYERDQQVIMPPLITHPVDIEHVQSLGSRPNFITTKKVQSPVVHIESAGKTKNIDNKIVMIESADPGFDWIFTHPIKGLITKYGGAASHMAIRCAEFDLPAAIGVGQQFEALQQKHTVCIDCANHSLS